MEDRRLPWTISNSTRLPLLSFIRHCLLRYFATSKLCGSGTWAVFWGPRGLKNFWRTSSRLDPEDLRRLQQIDRCANGWEFRFDIAFPYPGASSRKLASLKRSPVNRRGDFCGVAFGQFAATKFHLSPSFCVPTVVVDKPFEGLLSLIHLIHSLSSSIRLFLAFDAIRFSLEMELTELIDAILTSRPKCMKSLHGFITTISKARDEATMNDNEEGNQIPSDISRSRIRKEWTCTSIKLKDILKLA